MSNTVLDSNVVVSVWSLGVSLRVIDSRQLHMSIDEALSVMNQQKKKARAEKSPMRIVK